MMCDVVADLPDNYRYIAQQLINLYVHIKRCMSIVLIFFNVVGFEVYIVHIVHLVTSRYARTCMSILIRSRKNGIGSNEVYLSHSIVDAQHLMP
jgi:hypothetical protein